MPIITATTTAPITLTDSEDLIIGAFGEILTLNSSAVIGIGVTGNHKILITGSITSRFSAIGLVNSDGSNEVTIAASSVINADQNAIDIAGDSNTLIVDGTITSSSLNGLEL